MLLDRAARSTARNFSTLFLACMIVMLPLELAYATVHRDAIATREYHSFIRDLPSDEKVQKVGTEELDRAERDRKLVTIIELVGVVLLLGVARRILEVDREGGVPTAVDGWTHGAFRPGPLPRPGDWGPVIASVVIGGAISFFAYQAGLLLVDLFPDGPSFAMLGVVEATARSLGLPWVLGAWAASAGGPEEV
jgi:hypothetical protein